MLSKRQLKQQDISIVVFQTAVQLCLQIGHLLHLYM